MEDLSPAYDGGGTDGEMEVTHDNEENAVMAEAGGTLERSVSGGTEPEPQSMVDAAPELSSGSSAVVSASATTYGPVRTPTALARAMRRDPNMLDMGRPLTKKQKKGTRAGCVDC